MVIPNEILTDYKEIYEKTIKLVNEESKNDPPTDPYRSHYNACFLLKGLKSSINAIMEALEDVENECKAEDLLKYKTILAFACRDLGRIYCFTEEVNSGETELRECLNLVSEHKLKPAAIIPYVGALNEIGMLEANRQAYQDAQEYLNQAEITYKEFKANSDELKPLAITDILGIPDEVEGSIELESLYTLCCFYLAQVYGHLSNPEKSAYYCQVTLKRQLESKKYDSIDFALNAATLSQYYIGCERFKAARHQLAAATLIMTQYKDGMLTPDMTEQQRNDTTENFKHRYADIGRCWAKYGLSLLQTSKNRLFNDDDDTDTCENNDKLTIAAKKLNLTETDTNYRFPSLELGAFENRISSEYCLTFDDAKLVFHFITDWLDQAKDYYKAETEATEYAKIIKDYAECYELIAFFEENPNNQAKMHKKRTKYYEELLELLNPVFYMNICRECWYGAGTAYTTILDIKLDDLKANDTNASPELIKKVNFNCMKAIKHFESYITSYVEENGTKWKQNMDTDEQRTMLYAHFHLGRLYYKFITPNPVQQMEHLNNCFKYYERFINEAAKHEEAATSLRGEIGVTQEMLKLLPMKIENIKKRINTA